MNIIKAVKTANKIQKVKVKTKKGLAVAGKFAIGAAVLGLGAYAIHRNKISKKNAKQKKDIERGKIANSKIDKIEYKKKRRIENKKIKKNETHGAEEQSEIHAESVDI